LGHPVHWTAVTVRSKVREARALTLLVGSFDP